MRKEAKENGEKVRTYVLATNSWYPTYKLFLFFKDGSITRSVKWSRSMEDMFLKKNEERLTYYDCRETLEVIRDWQNLGKLPDVFV